MEENSLISVIVPIYKVEKYLARCVDSILAQTYGNLEVILVDDGSPDNCGRICDEYAEKDTRIRVIHKKNGGLSDARNAGIDVARGEYLAFVDSDDWIVPETYDVLLNAAKKHGVKLVCAGRFDVDEGSDEKLPGLCPPREEVISGQELVRRIFRWDNVDSAAWDKLYHRDLFREIRYPVGRVVEDVPTTYRIALAAGQAAMIPVSIYCYFHRPDSITTAAVSEKTFHYPEHAEMVYRDIRENHPELEADARHLYVRGLGYIVQTLDMADKASRKKYCRELSSYRRQLRRQIPFFLSLGYPPRWLKRNFALEAAGLYRPMLKVYLFLKGRG